MASATHNLRDQHDAAILARDAVLQRVLQDAYAPIAADLRARLATLLDQIAARAAKGQTISPEWLMQAQRLPILIRQVDQQLAAFARVADTAISNAQQDAIALATDHAHALISDRVGVPPSVTVTWNRLPSEAIDQLVGRAYDGSPLSNLLDQIGPDAAATVKQALLTGLAAGDGPRQIAKTFEGLIDGGYKRAELIARTEILGAYRAASIANYAANSDVVEGWSWSSDSAACDICAAKNGQEHPLSAPFDTHPNCRCAPIPVTKSWADLGIEMSLSIADFTVADTPGITIGAWAWS